MSALEYYIVTLAVFGAINGILVLGLNIQFGTAGILNFAYILLVSVGAYATGVAALPPASASSVNQYIGGFGLAFPWDLLFGTAVAVVFAFVLGGVALLRLRTDYLALTLFAISLGLWQFTDNVVGFLNGDSGLSGIPAPGQSLSPAAFQFAFLGLALVLLAIVFVIMQLIHASPLGRAIRAIRDDEVAAASLGKNPWRVKMVAFLVGAFAAGLGGSLLTLYAGGWGPSSWQPTENLILIAAVIVGGRGRNVGVLLGSLLLMEGIVQGSKFIPVIADRPDLLADLQGISVGVVFLAVIWWRPQGLLPERKEKFKRVTAVPAVADSDKQLVT